MKFISKVLLCILGITFISNGIGLLLSGEFLSIFILILGALLLPPVFDRFNFEFARKNALRRIFKAALVVLGFLAIGKVADDLSYSNKSILSKSITSFENEVRQKGVLGLDANYVDSIVTHLELLNEPKIDSVSIFISDIRKIRELVPELDDKVSLSSNKDGTLISNMIHFEGVLRGDEVQFLSNETLNDDYNYALQLKTPKRSSFLNVMDYYNYRLNHAKKINYPATIAEFVDSVLITDRNIEINETDLATSIKRYQIEPVDFNRLFRQAKKFHNKSFVVNQAIAIYFKRKEKLKNSYSYFQKALAINENSLDILNELAEIANKRKIKKSTVKYLEKIKDLNGLTTESCNLLRDLTRYFSHWTYYSNCCDGTTSSSTGRGTCSHHRGVCSTGRTANYRYKYLYCR